MKKISAIILSIFIILSNFVVINILLDDSAVIFNVSAFPGGDGSPGNPYQISNVTELQNMSSNLSAHYILINDINASITTTWNWNGTIYNGFIPIANDTDPATSWFQGVNFSGSFDGQGYNITGLFMNRSTDEYIGLFGRVNSSAVFKNVNIINYSVFGDFYVGGLIAYNNGGTVTNCNTTGTINVPGDSWSDTHYLGGLIGYNLGPVTNCITKGDIYNSGEYAGGLIGENDATVTNCTSYVNVTGLTWGGGYKGGLIGYNFDGSVINCTAYGYIIGFYDLGGLIGDSWGPVTGCSAYGNVTGGLQYGGLIGMAGSVVANCSAYGNVQSTGVSFAFALGGLIGSNCATVINCSVYGDIYGPQQVGGLLGLNDGIVTNCTVYGNTMGSNDSWAIGGLVGENEGGTITDCIVYGNANGTDTGSWDTGGLVGYNEQGTIKNCISYANTSGYEGVGGLFGWNDDGVATNCTAYGDVNGTGDYVGGLIGCSDGVVANCTAYGDVNGTSVFTGGLIGWNVGMVTNCNTYGNINGTADIVGGLIGWNDNAGSVIDCNVYGDIDCYGDGGGLIGFNVGKVTNCSVYGTVNGTYYMGGLIGSNEGIVTNCTAYNYVNGTEYLGGLIGYNDGVVSNCTAYSDLNGTHDLGGLIGYNLGTVMNCIAYGNINGTYGLGGLIGQMDDGAVTNCTAFGNVTGAYGYGWNIGGLIGAVGYGTVTNSNAYGNVYGTYEFIGGLIGFNYGPVTKNCNAYGDVNGTADYVGGLIGENCDEVINCNAYGNTTGKNYVGGLFGLSSWIISNCTAYGNVTGNWYVGGLTGFNYEWADVINCTAYGNASGNESVGGLIGFNDGWIVTGCIAYGNTTGNSSVGGLIGNNTKTVNKCTSYGFTNGTIYVGGLIGYNSGTLGNSSSYGNTSGDYYVGGVTGINKGIVTNCTAYGNTTGKNSDYIGGLIGYNTGKVTNSSAYGNTTGDVAIGGLIGFNFNTGTVYNCTAEGDVYGLSDVGGLIGNNSGIVNKCGSSVNVTVSGTYFVGGLMGVNTGITTNCYSHSPTTGDIYVGGLIGYNQNTAKHCYSVGAVTGNSYVGGLVGTGSGTVSCFWDNQTSGYTTSAGGSGAQGRNTTEMMMQVTFLTAGWDFVDTWGVDDGDSYPVFVFWYNPPLIVTLDVKSATEDVLYSVDYDAIYSTQYPGNGIASWKLVTNATGWLTIDANGVLSGTPTNNNIGSYWVNVTVTDLNNGADSHNFTLTVQNVNDPPIITTPNNTTAFEDVFYSVDYDATDIDPTGDSIFWNYSTNATWLNFNKLTGLLYGTPTDNDIGTYWVNITVTDNKNGLNSTNFTLVVNNVNDLPLIITSNVLTATEEVPYSVDYDALDPDLGDILTWELNTTAIWLSIDPSTGLLSGTPMNDDVGDWQVNVSVTDGQSYDLTSFILKVENVNDLPEIITEDVTTAYEEELYIVDYNATDLDIPIPGDTLSWSLITNASWLSIDQSTGNLSGVPGNSDVGIWNVNVTVSDSAGIKDFHEFTLTVYNVNNNPFIVDDIEDLPQSTYEDELYSYDFDAVDIDPTGDTIIWVLNTDAEWLSIDSDGNLSGIPTNDHANSMFWVNITAKDDARQIAGIVYINYSLWVINVNDDPIITTEDVEEAVEDDLYQVDYKAIDIDPTEDILTWSYSSNADWLAFDTFTGILAGIPTNDEVGSFWINITVSDDKNGKSWHNFTLTVSNVNDPPIITTQDVKSATVEELYYVDYNATDIDPTNDILTWTIITNASSWLGIDPSTGVLEGTPSWNEKGIFLVNITVEDGNDGADYREFMLTVYSTPNLLPEILTEDVTSAVVGKLYSVTYEADDDRTPLADLVWTMSTNATWLGFDTSTHVLSGTPLDIDIGSFWVYITVTDEDGGQASTNFTISVTKTELPTNIKPKLTNGKMSPESGDADTDFTFSVTYSDEDNDPGNVYVWINGGQHKMTPDPADTDYSDGVEYSYMTKLGEGEHTYYFTANDGTDNAESGDGATPTTDMDAKRTPNISGPPEKEAGGEDWIIYLIIIIIIIVVIVIGALVYKSKRTVEARQIEEEEQSVDRQEVQDGSIVKEHSPTEYIMLDPDEVIKELKQKALGPDKPSGLGLTEQDILQNLENRYRNNEISQETFYTVQETLQSIKP
ncbi:MAG: putative Ig domain-containing protein, partial [Thermoplasmata archaeon]|nr:putative Ig domain-containing protein [Thermoplasmata archaeon]